MMMMMMVTSHDFTTSQTLWIRKGAESSESSQPIPAFHQLRILGYRNKFSPLKITLRHYESVALFDETFRVFSPTWWLFGSFITIIIFFEKIRTSAGFKLNPMINLWRARDSSPGTTNHKIQLNGHCVGPRSTSYQVIRMIGFLREHSRIVWPWACLHQNRLAKQSIVEDFSKCRRQHAEGHFH